MAIYITGDTHGFSNIDPLEVDALYARGIFPTEEDYLIICGDVFLPWETQPQDLPMLAPSDKNLIRLLTDLPWTVLYIDGNHENHNTLANMPVSVWHGGKVHKIADRLYHLMRGQIFKIEKKTFFAFGGASSKGPIILPPGLSDPDGEEADVEQQFEGLENLAKQSNSVDFVITHTCPDSILRELSPVAPQGDKTSHYLEQVLQKVDFKAWYFGHFHRDRAGFSDNRFSCVYSDIRRVV